MRVMVTGETSVGKTTYLLKAAMHKSFLGDRVIMYTTERTSYILKLRAMLGLSPEHYNVSLVSEIDSIVDVREDFLHNHDGIFSTVILDGAQYLMDINSATETLDKLAPFMNHPGMDFMFSVPYGKQHFENETDRIFGSVYLSQYCDRIISLSNKNGKVRAKLLKDRHNNDMEFPVRLI